MQYLKCDALGCQHVETVEAISEDLIGKPCPLCGANLLTAEDQRNWAANVAPVLDLAHALEVLKPASIDDLSGDAQALRIALHGSRLTIDRIGPK